MDLYISFKSWIYKNHFKQESKQMRVYNVGNLSKEKPFGLASS